MLRIILTFMSGALIAAAQQPVVSNATLRTSSAAGGLDAAVKAAIDAHASPFWIGYTVPVIPGDRHSCCWSNDSRGCGLEGQRSNVFAAPGGPVKLEGPTHATVLLRVDNKQVEKIRSFSMDCPLDAGGLTLAWLSEVRPAESVAMLERYVGAPNQHRLGEGALHAIAMHADPQAEKTLERFASAGNAESLRKTSMFWLANSRGRRGYEIVSRIAREDTNEKVREHAIFALTQSREPEAISSIIRMAKQDSSAKVRGQALFWLAQKASQQAAKTITESLEQDPDTEVRKKAVFALSQLPKDEGVPLLIQVARTNANPAVRKQAMFWLGQSRDPRAVRFFEEILAK